MFQLEESELAAEPLPDRDNRNAILLYEAAEGGAGVLSRLVSDLQAIRRVAVRSLEVAHWRSKSGLWADNADLEDTDASCEAGCYSCLLSYANQPDHVRIDRKHKAVLDLLCRLARADASAGSASGARAEDAVDALQRSALAQLPDGSWSRTTPNDGDTSAALAAILKVANQPMPTRRIRLAAALILEPRLLVPLLPQPRAQEWQRLVGLEASVLPGGVVGLVQRTNPSWGRAVIQFRGNGWLRENGEARTWQAGLGLDAFETDGWPDGRAGFVLEALSTIDLDGAITSMPEDVRGWIADAEAA